MMLQPLLGHGHQSDFLSIHFYQSLHAASFEFEVALLNLLLTSSFHLFLCLILYPYTIQYAPLKFILQQQRLTEYANNNNIKFKIKCVVLTEANLFTSCICMPYIRRSPNINLYCFMNIRYSFFKAVKFYFVGFLQRCSKYVFGFLNSSRC